MNVKDGLHNLPDPVGVSQTSPVTQVSSVTAVQTQPASMSPESSGAVQDRAEVSTAAGLAHQAMQLPDARMEKVAAVQQAIANGSYQVSTHDVADKLMRQMAGE